MPKRKSAARNGSEGELAKLVSAQWFKYNPAAKAMLFAMVVGEMMLSPASKPRQVKHVQVEYAGSGASYGTYDIGPDTMPCDVLDRIMDRATALDYELRVGHNGPVVKSLWDSISNGATLVVSRRCFKGTVVAMPDAFGDSLTRYDSTSWHPSGIGFVIAIGFDIRFWNLVTNSWGFGFTIQMSGGSKVCRDWSPYAVGYAYCPRNMEYSPDGIHIAIQFADNLVHILNTRTGHTTVIKSKDLGAVRSSRISWSSTGIYLAVAGTPCSSRRTNAFEDVAIWDSRTGDTTTLNLDVITGVTLNEDSARMNIATLDWSPTHDHLALLVGPPWELNAVDDDSIEWCEGVSVLVLDMTTSSPQCLHRMNFGDVLPDEMKKGDEVLAKVCTERGWRSNINIFGLHYHPDGKRLLAGAVIGSDPFRTMTTYGCILVPETDALSVVKVNTLDVKDTAPMDYSSMLYTVRCNPDGIRFVIGASGTIVVWNCQTRQVEYTDRNPPRAIDGRGQWCSTGGKWNPTGTRLVVMRGGSLVE